MMKDFSPSKTEVIKESIIGDEIIGADNRESEKFIDAF